MPRREGRAELALEVLIAGDVPELGQVGHDGAELADVRLNLRDRHGGELQRAPRSRSSSPATCPSSAACIGQREAEVSAPMPSQAIKSLRKKAKKGFRGYPVATVIYYGPDDRRATKVVVGIIRGEGEEASDLERWHSTSTDARQDVRISTEIAAFIARHQVRTIALMDRIYGCPHEEGKDYEGTCPLCPFWAGRDRATGQHLH